MVAGVLMEDKLKDPTPEEIHLGLSLIAEEFVELLSDGFGLSENSKRNLENCLSFCIQDCIDSGVYDPKGAADALGDSDVVINRFGGVLGFNMDKISELVYNSNMSKFTRSLDVAEETVAEYLQKGRKTHVEEIQVQEEGMLTSRTFYVIKDSETGKILKAKSFKEPDFSSILNS